MKKFRESNISMLIEDVADYTKFNIREWNPEVDVRFRLIRSVLVPNVGGWGAAVAGREALNQIKRLISDLQTGGLDPIRGAEVSKEDKNQYYKHFINSLLYIEDRFYQEEYRLGIEEWGLVQLQRLYTIYMDKLH